MSRPWTLATTLVIALAVVGACKSEGADSPPAAEGWRQMYDDWTEPDPIPPFELIDEDGKAFTLDRYEDAYVILGFIFTRCPQPEACPLTMKRMTEVQKAWAAAQAAGKTGGKTLEILVMTLDPEFDKPPQLKAYAEHHGADVTRHYTIATGPTELMESALPSLFAVLALPKGPGEISHSVKVAVLEPGLLFLKDWRDNEFTADEVVQLVSTHQPEPEGD